jgi:N-methylhydantoinase A
MISIAVSNMSRAIRSVSTEKGHDVAQFALFPYGGAGPLHAAAVAAESGIRRVLIPVEPGTLCARGILLSDISLDLVRSAITEVRHDTWPRIMAAFAAMVAQGRAWLATQDIAPQRRRFDLVVDARYKGQNHEVQVRMDTHSASVQADGVIGIGGLDSLADHFAETHRREYGYTADRPIEIVNCRVKAVGLIDRPSAVYRGGSGPPAPKARRPVHFETGWLDTPIHDRIALAIGAHLGGPAVIEEMSATTLVPPDWRLHVTDDGNLLLETA